MAERAEAGRDDGSVGCEHETSDEGTGYCRIAEAAMEIADRHLAEIERLREGLRRIKNSDFDSGYSWSDYAEAVLSGDEPTGKATVDG